jgi:preprotein translocase subunit SecD
MARTRRELVIGAALAGLFAGMAAPTARADDPNDTFAVRPVDGDDLASPPAGDVRLPQVNGEGVWLSPKVLLTADMVKSAYPVADGAGGVAVRFEFTEAGRRILADYSTAHVGERVAFVVNWVVLATPVIRDPMTGGVAEVSGDFSADTLQVLAAAFPDPRWAALKPAGPTQAVPDR